MTLCKARLPMSDGECAVKWSEHELELGMMDYTCGRLDHRTRAPEPGVRRGPRSIMCS